MMINTSDTQVDYKKFIKTILFFTALRALFFMLLKLLPTSYLANPNYPYDWLNFSVELILANLAKFVSPHISYLQPFWAVFNFLTSVLTTQYLLKNQDHLDFKNKFKCWLRKTPAILACSLIYPALYFITPVFGNNIISYFTAIIFLALNLITFYLPATIGLESSNKILSPVNMIQKSFFYMVHNFGKNILYLISLIFLMLITLVIMLELQSISPSINLLTSPISNHTLSLIIFIFLLLFNTINNCFTAFIVRQSQNQNN